jgi:hypothetical protein
MPKLMVVVTALVLERALCMDCIVAKASATPEEIEAVLFRLSRVLRLHRAGLERCRACGNIGATISLDRPSR